MTWVTREHVRFRESFDLGHEIWAGDRLVADATSVLVGYDYTTGATVPLTDDQRRRLENA